MEVRSGRLGLRPRTDVIGKSDRAEPHDLDKFRSPASPEGRRTICVVGLGYIGLATSAMLASRHFTVLGFDLKSDVVEAVNDGRAHIDDPGLSELVAETVATGHLKAFTAPQEADTFIIAVPTPVRHENDNEPDLSYVFAAGTSIAPVLRSGNLVILESTSPVGTTERLSALLAAERPGTVIGMNAREVGLAVVGLGGGRTHADDAIDHQKRIAMRQHLEDCRNSDRVDFGDSIGHVASRDCAETSALPLRWPETDVMIA